MSEILAGQPWRGMAGYVRHLVQEWSREREVWALGSLGRDPSPGFAGQVRVSRWNWGWQEKIALRTDVLYCPSARVPNYFYALHRPRVVYVGGARPFALQGTKFSRGPRPHHRQLRERQEQIDVVIVDSNFSKEEALRYYEFAPDKVEVIYPGLDPAVFFPASDKAAARALACQRFQLPGAYLFHVSNYRPVKNVPRIVAAYDRLLERGTLVAALVLAGGSLQGEDEVARAIGKCQRGRVIRLGPREATELAELYRGAEALVFPSIHEGFGRCAVESMACGTPVLASHTTAFPEVTAGAALLVNPESEEAIADGLAALLGNPTLQADYQRRGLARSREFRWDICAQRHLEAFARACARFQGRSTAAGLG